MNGTLARQLTDSYAECIEGHSGIVDLGAGYRKWGRRQEPYLGVDLEGDDANLRVDMRDVDEWMKHANGHDTVVLMDSLEHLTLEDGLALLCRIENIFRVVVVFSPDGYVKNAEYTGLQEHLSGWTPEMLEERGYETIGLWPGFHGPPIPSGAFLSRYER